MTALATNVNRRQKSPVDVHDKVVASGQHIYVGSACGVKPADGLLYPMGAHATLKCVGVARAEVVGDGVLTCETREGVWPFDNSTAGDAIAETDVGQIAYAVDDNTVAKTSNGGLRAPMGVIQGLSASGQVQVACGVSASASGDAVENLVHVGLRVDTLVGSNVYRVVSPVAGRIRKVYSVIDGVLTTGDATLTGKIGAAAITGGVITITQSGSAAGDVDSCTPSAANTVAEGDVISFTVGGTNATATVAKLSILIDAV
jgi:hypothetical protein